MDENIVPADELPPLPTPPGVDDPDPEVFAVRRDGATWAVNRRGFLTAGAAGTGAAAGCGKKPDDVPPNAVGMPAAAPAAKPSSIAHSDRVTAAAAAGGRVFTAGLDGKVRVWNSSTGSPIVVLDGPPGSIRLLTATRDGTRLAAVTDTGGGRVWSVPGGEEVTTFTGSSAPASAALSDHGTQLYIQDANRVIVHTLPARRGGVVQSSVASVNTGTQQAFVRRAGGFAVLCVSSELRLGGEGRVLLYAFPSGAVEATFPLPGSYLSTPGYLTAAPGGDRFTLVTPANQLEVWSLREGRRVAAGQLGGAPAGVHFPDDTTLVVLANRSVTVYRIDPPQLVTVRQVELRADDEGEGDPESPPTTPGGAGGVFAVDAEAVVTARGRQAFRWSLADGRRLAALVDPSLAPAPAPTPAPTPAPVQPSPPVPRTGGGGGHYWRPN